MKKTAAHKDSLDKTEASSIKESDSAELSSGDDQGLECHAISDAESKILESPLIYSAEHLLSFWKNSNQTATPKVKVARLESLKCKD